MPIDDLQYGKFEGIVLEKLGNIEKVLGEGKERFVDHDKRLKSLEIGRAWWGGGAAMLGFGLGVIKDIFWSK